MFWKRKKRRIFVTYANDQETIGFFTYDLDWSEEIPKIGDLIVEEGLETENPYYKIVTRAKTLADGFYELGAVQVVLEYRLGATTDDLVSGRQTT